MCAICDLASAGGEPIFAAKLEPRDAEGCRRQASRDHVFAAAGIAQDLFRAPG